ncbi:MAG: toll/interleukin-1 receptor domain-containing protein [Synergistaceae bacterium]|nr:toll/interleukin-1 receptor domain-containing protein [Synergistaceae bacterium]
MIPCSLEDESFVFVSYAHSDAWRVFPIIESVSGSGFSIWYDKGINISSTWTDEIAAAIMKCKIFIVFITKESVGSSYVRSEIEFALNNKIRTIPVYLDGMEVLPPGLALGLNSTQGITDTKNSTEIAHSICEALDYNKISKQNKSIPSVAKNGENDAEKEGSSPKYLRVAIAAAIVIAIAALGLSRLNAPPIGPDAQGTAANTAPSARGAYSMDVVKTGYAPAELIHVNISGVPQGMIDEGAIVGICETDAPHGEFASSEFITGGDARITLRAPLSVGKYEIRGYGSGNAQTEETLVSSVPITVGGSARDAFSIEIYKSKYSPQETIRTKVTGVPKYMLDDGAIMGVYDSGAPHDKFRTYVSIRERDFDSYLLDAPIEVGDYEIRGYSSWSVWADETLVTKVKFKVMD